MIPLFTSKQIRQADSYGIDKLGIPGVVLMENAARSIYSAIKKFFPELSKAYPIGFLAGKGNNGGDAFAAARHFYNAGFQVKILSIGKEQEIKGDAKLNYLSLKNILKGSIQSKLITYKSLKDLEIFSGCQLIVDGLLGTGSSGQLREPYKKIVEAVNEINCLKAAIDAPTGLDLDKGSGETVFDADMTVTLAEYKRGLFYAEGYINAGEIFKGRIGLDDSFFDRLNVEDYLIEPEDVFIGLPERKLNVHKYSAGKTLVIAGSSKYPGAPALTANSALHSGSGAVFLAVPKSISGIVHNKVDSVVIKSFDDGNDGYLKPSNLDEIIESIEWADSIAIGPGIGRETGTLESVREIVKRYPEKNFVIDADALYAFNLKNLKKLNVQNVVFTPHYKEFAGMIGESIEEVKKDILHHGRKFAKTVNTFLVLKGAPTIIFTPQGEALINSSGNPGLAKFGSGDVLTGVIASFIAQNKAIEKSVISAVYIHGVSADLLAEEFTELGITAEILLQNIPNAVKLIYDTFV